MFQKIFIERELQNHPEALNLKNQFKSAEVVEIDKVDDYFGKYKKPYLQKRDNLNLFLGKKRGQLVKEAPDAYGLSGEPHYYFIHAYNCIYECNYCYLQGYFHSPDIVLFLNHNEIVDQMSQIAGDKSVWFHAGEFSDSLALSHLTKELDIYFDFFKSHPNAKLELRTKSANTRELLKHEALPNVITSFSLSPADKIKENDLLTPSLTHRLKAMKELNDNGHKIAIHFDPIIFDEDIVEKYETLTNLIEDYLPISSIQYISLGVVRFTKDVFHQVKKNYPESEYFKSELISDKQNLVRYPRPMRLWLLNTIKSLLINRGVESDKVYLCME